MVKHRARIAAPPTEERRRVPREEGLLLVFAAAQDVARQDGALRDGVQASLSHSLISNTGYTLKTSTGSTIARVPLQRAREVIRLRRQVARRITRSTQLQLSAHGNDRTNLQKFRTQPESIRALAWAISKGKRFPRRDYGEADLWIGIALLALGIVPGVIVLTRLQRKRKRYRQALRELVLRWHAAGKQDPAPNLFAHLNLDH
jgi:hypothetical protein